MEAVTKSEIGARLRAKREQAGYTREQLGELSGLSPRFIANIEFGDSTFSLDSLMKMCRVLSCSSDFLLFGNSIDNTAWSETTDMLQQLDLKYREPVSRIFRSVLETIAVASEK